MILVLFALVYPLAVFLISLKHIKKKEFHYVFILLAVLFGLVIKIEADDVFSGDITRYIAHVEGYKTMTWDEIFSGSDFVIVLITRVLLLISSNTRFIMVSYYVIFAIFLSQSYRIVFNQAEISNDFKFYFYVLTALLVIPLTYLNALRFALATAYYLWCLLEVVVKEKKRFYGLIFITPFIHFSYWGFVLLPFFHLMFRNRLKIVWLVFILSVILHLTPATSYFIADFSGNVFNETANAHISAYASEEGLYTMNERYATIAANSNINRVVSEFFLNARNYGVMWLLFLLSVLDYKTIRKNQQLESIITLLLLAFTLTNIFSSASNGNRFFATSIAITVWLFFILMRQVGSKYSVINKEFIQKHRFLINFIFILVFANGLLTLYMDRKGFDYIHVLIGNFITPYLY